jgi:glycosyltransferase involved in cell wall biosynthesis
LLYVGSLAPNKNLPRAVEAFELVRQPDEKLVIVGSVATNVFKQSIPVAGEHIVLAGRVSDDELKTLYRHAVALIFPSIYEGFGLPPLEAMANGCVVLASNIEPVREVCAEAAVYFDPFAPEQIASVFRQALSGTLDRARLVRAGRQRASLYTWQASAEALRCTVYKILDKGTGR